MPRRWVVRQGPVCQRIAGARATAGQPATTRVKTGSTRCRPKPSQRAGGSQYHVSANRSTESLAGNVLRSSWPIRPETFVVNADGEIIYTDANHLDVELLPAALDVIA